MFVDFLRICNVRKGVAKISMAFHGFEGFWGILRASGSFWTASGGESLNIWCIWEIGRTSNTLRISCAVYSTEARCRGLVQKVRKCAFHGDEILKPWSLIRIKINKKI